jgi:polyisoprenyl-phosphate glycosyltransferase
VLPLLRERLQKIRTRPAAYELFFISDGSTDGSIKSIEEWAQIDRSVKLVVLTRNFGHQSAISAGLSLASGKCVGIMEADSRDELEVLPEMYQAMLAEKLNVVYAMRTSRQPGETQAVQFQNSDMK